MERIPFQEAIEEPLLLKHAFDELSLPQKVALKIAYGLPLNEEELRMWSVFQGGAEFDGLGFPVKIEPVEYRPREYEDVTAIFGRRSGKTDKFESFIIVYEALLGGHENYLGRKQKGRIFFVGQDQDHAIKNIEEFVLPLIESSQMLCKEIVKQNSDGILLKNRLAIVPGYPNIKIFRSYAIPVVVLDESGFYYKDAESANPDFEIIRAIEPSMAQFPDRKRISASTPWSKDGILWEDFNAGTSGGKIADPEERGKYKDLLVLHAPTPAMDNPILDRRWFAKQFIKDPDAYVREILARFVDSISGLIPEALLRLAVVDAPKQREALPRGPGDPSPVYIAAMDPAFRHDKFAFTILHHDPREGLVQDLICEWKPQPDVRLDPEEILSEIASYLRVYHTTTVYSDQYQLESLQQLALQKGFVIVGIDFTRNSKSKIYGSFLNLLRQGKVRLLDHPEQFQELLALERHTMPGGTVGISAPLGKYDDLASALVLASSRCLWLDPALPVEHKEPSTVEKCLKQIERMRKARQSEEDI